MPSKATVRVAAENRVIDQGKLFRELTPSPSKSKTVYRAPVLIDFLPGSGEVTLYVQVGYQPAGGEWGSTLVTYILVPASSGQPYRIRSVTERHS